MTCKLCAEFYEKYPLKKMEDIEGRVEYYHQLSERVSSSPIMCAFDDDGNFKKDNWSCKTMSVLRAIANDTFRMRDDSSAGSIGVLMIPEECALAAGYIVMTWYKDRGKTGSAIIANDDDEPRILTLHVAEDVVKRLAEGGRGE